MDYVLNFISTSNDADIIQKPSITVKEGEANYSTSLTFVGKNYPDYGKIIWNNFLYLLENFASKYSPDLDRSTAGQLWYDTNEARLKVYDGISYDYIQGSPSSNLNLDNLLGLLDQLTDEDITRLFGSYFIFKKVPDTKIGRLDVLGEMTAYTPTDISPPSAVVTKEYINNIVIGKFDNVFSDIFLPKAGGNMNANANVAFTGDSYISVPKEPQNDYHLTNKQYVQKHFLTFDNTNKNVPRIEMSDHILLSSDNCGVTDDSFYAVSAKWVTERLKNFTVPSISGDFIPRISTSSTNVDNTLIFKEKRYIHIDIDESTERSVVNKKYVDNKFIKKAGDTDIGPLKLKDHPISTSNDLSVPTTKWVKDLIGTDSSIKNESKDNVKWVEFPNGMVIITGSTKSNAVAKQFSTNNGLPFGNPVYTHSISVTLPVSLKVPYTVVAHNPTSTADTLQTMTINSHYVPTSMNQTNVIASAVYSSTSSAPIEVAYTITGSKP